MFAAAGYSLQQFNRVHELVSRNNAYHIARRHRETHRIAIDYPFVSCLLLNEKERMICVT